MKPLVARRVLGGLAIIVMTLPLLAAPGHADGESRTTPYYGAQGAVIVWCEAGGHEVISTEPRPDGPESIIAWLFSGRPECVPGDSVYGTEQGHGVGGMGYCVNADAPYDDCSEHRGHVFTASADDALGPAPLTLIVKTPHARVSWQSCGTVSGTIPQELHSRWGTIDAVETVWVNVDAVRLDTDTLATCLGATGLLHATY